MTLPPPAPPQISQSEVRATLDRRKLLVALGLGIVGTALFMQRRAGANLAVSVVDIGVAERGGDESEDAASDSEAKPTAVVLQAPSLQAGPARHRIVVKALVVNRTEIPMLLASVALLRFGQSSAAPEMRLQIEDYPDDASLGPLRGRVVDFVSEDIDSKPDGEWSRQPSPTRKGELATLIIASTGGEIFSSKPVSASPQQRKEALWEEMQRFRLP